jgi:hypothetical protein
MTAMEITHVKADQKDVGIEKEKHIERLRKAIKRAEEQEDVKLIK